MCEHISQRPSKASSISVMMFLDMKRKESCKMMLKKLLVCFGFLAILTGHTCLAAEIKGVSFADQVVLEKHAVRLKGVAVLKWAMLFDVYAGAFYLPDNVAGSAWAQDVPKRLELSYFRDIEAKGFADASDKLLRDNLPGVEYQPLAERLQAFYSFFQDVKPGDRYSIDYIPEQGVELRLNNKSLGRVPGADFAVAYFGIWLGENPINKTFRDKLLNVR